MGRSSGVKVIRQRLRKTTRKMQDGRREILMMIETVSVAGALLLPMIVYKGQKYYRGSTALAEAGDKAYFVISDKGWTSSSISIEFLVRNFEPITRARG